MKPIEIIVITYNRPEDTLELLENLCSLEDAVTYLEKIILLNNASTSDYSRVENFIKNQSSIPIHYIQSNKNLGVTAGRNHALQFSQTPIIVFLDDDALLEDNNTLKNILHAFEKKSPQNRETGLVSFRVLYYPSLVPQINALPHKKVDKYLHQDFFATYYFAGGAHAIKRDLLLQLGGLPEDFFYGMEEYDISYRLLEAGYGIVYDASITMLHKESPLGRTTKKEKWQMMWLNKCRVAWRYLPKKYFYSTAILWSFKYLSATKMDIKGWWHSWIKILSIPTNENRFPISTDSLKYLEKVEARLWY
ncbi:MAG: glycosyltransferase [Hydrotalea sp.]|jgi:GT2 family glycosyltransferase|nr:glycosyltransferase [Hydrotalea sp.]